jgi:acyl carrier protein
MPPKYDTDCGTSETVISIIKHQLGKTVDTVNDTDSFVDDLGTDSLDSVELVIAFEDTFGIEISDEDAESITTVDDAVRIIDTLR